MRLPRRWLLCALLILAAAQLACGKFEIFLLTPTPKGYTGPTLTPEPSEQVRVTTTPSPNTQSTTPDVTSRPTRVVLKEPSFSEEVRFYIEPDPEKSQRIFPPGTRQIFAIWDYANMRSGTVVRREWYKDTKLWLVREVPWDFSRYGSNGTIADVTLFDFEKGLEPGLYWLRLYIDDVPQFEETNRDTASFKLMAGKVLDSVPSPDGKFQAIISDPRTLSIREQDGNQRILVITTEISSLAWFPNSKHIVYSVRDRKFEGINDLLTGYRDELWLVDVTSGLRIRLSTPEENLSFPQVSPDSRYIASLTGYNQPNNCTPSLSIVFIELDEQLNRVALHRMIEFSGLPEDTNPPIPRFESDTTGPGLWLTRNQYQISLVWPCTEGNENGDYQFDVETWQVVKIQ